MPPPPGSLVTAINLFITELLPAYSTYVLYAPYLNTICCTNGFCIRCLSCPRRFNTPKPAPPVDQISKEMSDDDFHERVQPAIAGLFAVNDRGVRVMLLSSIPSYGKRLEDKVVNDQVSSRGIRSKR